MTSWITVIWSATAGICLTLAGVHFLVWVKSRDSWANLFFSIAAVSAAVTSVFEMDMMHAPTPEVYDELLRWSYVPVGLMVVSVAWFVRCYLRGGSIWLVWLLCVCRALILMLTFTMDSSLHFLEITGLRQVHVWGEIVVAPVGVENPWAYWANATTVLLIIITIDAAIAAWRRGNHRQAAVVGSTIIGATVLGITMSVMLAAGMLRMPYTLSLVFLIIVLGMAYELSVDLINAGQLSRELYQSRERMRLAVNAANLGVWDWDIANDEFWVTDNIRERTGIGASERIDLERLLHRVHSDDRERVRRTIQDALEIAEDFEIEYRGIAAGGETRFMVVRGRIARDGNGKPVHLRGVSLDITERKQAEAEARRQQAELAHVSRVATMGHLSTALAHELSQPLGAILRNTEAGELFLQHDPPDYEELKSILADIRRDDQRAAAVIDRMRSQLRRQEPVYERLSVGELLEQTIALAHSECQARHVVAHADIRDDLPPVRGDRVQLQQVMLNLVVNALDAMDDVPVDQRRLVVTARRAGERSMEVAVSDTGHGIPAGHEAHVFEPFHTTKAEGLGMGLAISRTIIESHGGRIRAERNPDGGATFRFTLNVVESKAIA